MSTLANSEHIGRQRKSSTRPDSDIPVTGITPLPKIPFDLSILHKRKNLFLNYALAHK